MRVFSKVGLAAALVAAAALVSPAPASADIILTLGNVGSIDDDTITLDNGETGTTILGDLEGGFTARFVGIETLESQASGQARIESADGNGFNYLKFDLVGADFTSLILNIDASAAGTADFFGRDTDGNLFSFLDTAVGTSGSFYTLQAINGQRIAYLEFFSDVPIHFVDMGQFRVGGAQNSDIVVSPEPASMLLFGTGIVALVARRRSRR